MSKKASYNNQMLAIYISQADFDQLLDNKVSIVPLYIGKVDSGINGVVVSISTKAQELLRKSVSAERAEILKVQEAFRVSHPDYRSSNQTNKGRRSHA
jgi:hypothetical protein